MTTRPSTAGVLAALAVVSAQALLAAGFALGGRPLGIAAALVCAVAWLAVLVVRLRGATACLVATLAAAVLAALTGAPGLMPVAASAVAVAAWDLTLLAGQAGSDPDGPQERLLIRSRARALAAGLLPGLALAGLLGGARLAIPFAAMLLVGALVLFSLDRAARRWR